MRHPPARSASKYSLLAEETPQPEWTTLMCPELGVIQSDTLQNNDHSLEPSDRRPFELTQVLDLFDSTVLDSVLSSRDSSADRFLNFAEVPEERMPDLTLGQVSNGLPCLAFLAC